MFSLFSIKGFNVMIFFWCDIKHAENDFQIKHYINKKCEFTEYF